MSAYALGGGGGQAYDWQVNNKRVVYSRLSGLVVRYLVNN